MRDNTVKLKIPPEDCDWQEQYNISEKEVDAQTAKK